MKKLCLLVLIAFFSLSVRAQVKPASMFTDNMVLQRDIKVPVWGTAAPGEKVIIQFAGQKVEAVADADGNWKATLAPLKTSAAPAEMVLSGTDSAVKMTNVLVGEIWLCSGQSKIGRDTSELQSQR